MDLNLLKYKYRHADRGRVVRKHLLCCYVIPAREIPARPKKGKRKAEKYIKLVGSRSVMRRRILQWQEIKNSFVAYLPPFCFYTLERRNMKNRNPFSSADFKCFTQIVFVFRLSLSRPQSVRLLIGNTFCLCFCIFYGSSNKESLTLVLS